jgi:hypothetical protein
MAAKKRKRGRPRGKRHNAEYQAIDCMSDDPLEVVEWAGKILRLSMQKIASDPNISEEARRRELRSTAKVINAMVPAERLLQAERAIRRADEEMGRSVKDPEMTKDAGRTQAGAAGPFFIEN